MRRNGYAAARAQEKQAQTIKGWGTVKDLDGDCKAVLDGKKMTIMVPKGTHDMTYRDDFTGVNAPRIVQDVDGDFTVQVRINAFGQPQANTSSNGMYSFVGSGLLIWLDDKNFIRLERSAEGNGGGLFVYLEQFQDAKTGKNKAAVLLQDKGTDLKVERKGDNFTFAFKEGDDAKEWTTLTEIESKLPGKLKVGVHAINTTTAAFEPVLEDLKLEELKGKAK